jgi:hypothetical protein
MALQYCRHSLVHQAPGLRFIGANEKHENSEAMQKNSRTGKHEIARPTVLKRAQA